MHPTNRLAPGLLQALVAVVQLGTRLGVTRVEYAQVPVCNPVMNRVNNEPCPSNLGDWPATSPEISLHQPNGKAPSSLLLGPA
jgi:hypothetical protein